MSMWIGRSSRADSADCLKDIVVGAEEVVSWRLGIDGAVDIFYNTVVVGDWERRWIGISVIREFSNHVSPASKLRLRDVSSMGPNTRR